MNKKNDLIYEIDGKEYLLVELPVVNTTDSVDYFKAIEKIGCIPQGIKEIHRGGWFSTPYAIAKYLVPVKKMNQYLKLARYD